MADAAFNTPVACEWSSAFSGVRGGAAALACTNDVGVATLCALLRSAAHRLGTHKQLDVKLASAVHRCAVRCGDSCACAAELVLAATLALHQLLKFPLACSAVVVPFEPLLARLVAVTSDAASASDERHELHESIVGAVEMALQQQLDRALPQFGDCCQLLVRRNPLSTRRSC